MPYETNADLPETVRDRLPDHAQDIYRAAFNDAWDRYADPAERRDPDDDREAIAHKVAWSAVKQKYERKDGDRWGEKA